MYSGFEVTFDSAGSWSFSNDSAANVIIFGVDNSSSSHADNHKNNFLVLGEGPTFGSAEKKFSINFSKASTKFCLRLHYNTDNSHLFVCYWKRNLFKFTADNKNVNFLILFCLGNISKGFSATESREVSLNGNAHNVSVYYSSINKSDILNICKYFFSLIKQVFTALSSFSKP